MSHGRPPQMLFKTHLFTCSLVHQVGGGRLAWSQWSGMVSSVKRFENERFFERKPSWKLTKRWAVHQPETRVWPALIRAGNSSKSRWSQLVREIAFYILQLWLRTFRAGGACLFSLPHNIPSSQPLKEQKSRCRNENSPGEDWTQFTFVCASNQTSASGENSTQPIAILGCVFGSPPITAGRLIDLLKSIQEQDDRSSIFLACAGTWCSLKPVPMKR